jgi:hypothetical protein
MASSKLAKLKEAVKKKKGGDTAPAKAEQPPKAAEPAKPSPRAEPPPEQPDKMTPEDFAMEPEKEAPKPRKSPPADVAPEPEAPKPAPQKAAKPSGPKPSPLTAPHAADVGSKIIRAVMDDTRLANFNQVSKVIMSCMLRRGEVEGKIKSVKDIVDEEVKKVLKEAA